MEHDPFLAHHQDYHSQAHQSSARLHSGYGSESPSDDIPDDSPLASNSRPLNHGSPTLATSQAFVARSMPGVAGPASSSPSPPPQSSYPASYSHSSLHLHTQDPYRSAYSQHQQQQQQQQQHRDVHQRSGSPFSDPSVPEYQSQRTQSSGYSQVSSRSGLSGGAPRYAMHTLQSPDSAQTPSDATLAASPTSTQRQQHSGQDSHPSDHKSKIEAEDENADILRRVSGRSAKHSTVTDSDEEGQERGALRYRDSKRCFCCSRRICVYITFVLMLCMAVALYFVIPRSPGFSYVSVAPLGAPIVTSDRIQEHFSLQMRVDNQENYIPLRIASLDMGMWMKIDQKKVGSNEGLATSYTLNAGSVQTISVPMMMDYTSLKIDTNADGTLQELISACKSDSSSGTLPQGINLTFGGKIYISGLSWIWKPQFSFNVEQVPCPVNARGPPEEPSPPSSESKTTSGTATATSSSSGGTSATALHTATASSLSHTPTGATGSTAAASTPSP